MINEIMVSGMDITNAEFFTSIFTLFSILIKQLALKVNEHVFFYKKGLTGPAQLGNIRIR